MTPFDLTRLFYGRQPPLFFVEIDFRAALVLLAAMLILKLTGKRSRRELTARSGDQASDAARWNQPSQRRCRTPAAMLVGS